MKRYYLTANLILGMTAILLLLWHFNFRPAPPDKALKRTFVMGDNKNSKTISSGPISTASPEIRGKNIFDPLRGKAPVTDSSNSMPLQNMPQLELVGICRLGETTGAIIVEKGSNPSGNRNNRGLKKRFFTQGEEVTNGFCLNDVEAEKIVLKRGHDVMELQIGRDRSTAQGKSAPRNNITSPMASVRSAQTYSRPPQPPAGTPRMGALSNKNINMPPPPQNIRR